MQIHLPRLLPIALVCVAATHAGARTEIRDFHADIVATWNVDSSSLVLGWNTSDPAVNGGAPTFLPSADGYGRILANQFFPAPAGWDFTGAAPGAPVWVGPSEWNSGYLYLGFSADLSTGLGFSGDVAFTLLSISGPGHVSLVGDSTPLWASSVAGTDTVLISRGGHNHFDWVFSAQGLYTLTIEASVLQNGERITTTENFEFHVGAIPEPGAYATLAGLSTLAAIATSRRRRRG